MDVGAAVRLPRLPMASAGPVWTAARLAEEVVAAVGRAAVRPAELAVLAGWEYREAPLMADAGGQDALLLPLSRGGFRVVVDPRLSPRQYWGGRRPTPALLASTVAFRGAHELGHTFFYDSGSPPARRVAATSDEETFCDLFAASLIVRDMGPATAAHVAAIARRLGGNVEVAALWAAAQPGVTVDLRDGSRASRFGRSRRRGRTTTASVGQVGIEVAA